MARSYTSVRSALTIHWPVEWVTVQTAGGEPRMIQRTPAPTQFRDGHYTARTDEEVARLEQHSSFKRDFFPVPTPDEIAAGEAEAAKHELAQLEARVAELRARVGTPGETHVSATSESSNLEPPKTGVHGSVGDAGSEGGDNQAAAKVLKGVSTKAEALEALAKAGGDVGFAHARTTTADIVSEAEKQGFAFEGWPE